MIVRFAVMGTQEASHEVSRVRVKLLMTNGLFLEGPNRHCAEGEWTKLQYLEEVSDLARSLGKEEGLQEGMDFVIVHSPVYWQHQVAFGDLETSDDKTRETFRDYPPVWPSLLCTKIVPQAARIGCRKCGSPPRRYYNAVNPWGDRFHRCPTDRVCVAMKDQYGSLIPGDLVAVSSESWMSEADIKRVLNARWYEPMNSRDQGPILVSRNAISDLLETDPEDVDVTAADKLQCVADALHRWSEEDGFYHA